MLTTMEEEVLELWTRTVTMTPMTSPATGFDNTAFSWKMSPAALPVRTQREGTVSQMPHKERQGKQ